MELFSQVQECCQSFLFPSFSLPVLFNFNPQDERKRKIDFCQSCIFTCRRNHYVYRWHLHQTRISDVNYFNYFLAFFLLFTFSHQKSTLLPFLSQPPSRLCLLSSTQSPLVLTPFIFLTSLVFILSLLSKNCSSYKLMCD